ATTQRGLASGGCRHPQCSHQCFLCCDTLARGPGPLCGAPPPWRKQRHLHGSRHPGLHAGP
ncbi:unnamed protein product, partial [Symbiodinium microadriaticum]